jgi:hypothetical protein
MFMNTGDYLWAQLLELAIVALPFIGLAIGAAWIIRIARGAGDDAKHWRYRKHR